MSPEPVIKRGLQDAPVPDEAVVLRAYKPPLFIEPGDIVPRETFTFLLSERDKSLSFPKLSVFVQGLTTEAQACALIGDGTTHRLVARLSVAAIRAISLNTHALEVVWDTAVLPNGTPDTRPGSEGHAGITGLKRPPQMEKRLFKTLQTRLADAVGANYVIIALAL